MRFYLEGRPPSEEQQRPECLKEVDISLFRVEKKSPPPFP